MKLLGHANAEMTMQHVNAALTDLQREFHQARAHPKYPAPQVDGVTFATLTKMGKEGARGADNAVEIGLEHGLEFVFGNLFSRAVDAIAHC